MTVGVGCSLGCSAAELLDLIAAAVGDAAVTALATVDRRREEPCVVAAAAHYGVPLFVHAASSLAAVVVPTPSAVVRRHVGTASVAEAAALLTAGPGARLVVTKRRSQHATCAVAA